MAGGAQSYENEEAGGGMIADINVTPLVDITLVLLIIMMVAAPIIANNPSIKIDLPKAATGDETQKSTLAFTLTKPQGGGPGCQIFLNGEKISEERVREVVKGALEKNKETQAVIAADKGIAYGDFIHIVDLLKSLGIYKYSMSTDGT